MWCSTGTIAKKFNVSRETVVNWINEGKYKKFKRTKGGHFRIWYSPDVTTILYARVSSSKQRTSIDKQEELLKEKYKDGKFIYDIGSGFNFKRRGFTSILEQALQGGSIKLVVTTSDRVARTGFSLIKKCIELHGGYIECLEEPTPNENFDVQTLISFLTSFCNSQSGKRSHNRYKKDQDLSKE